MKKTTQRQFSEIFNGMDFSLTPSDRREYENCEFINCVFSDLSNTELINCRLSNCNLSNALLSFSGMQQVEFCDCKLIGADFSPTKDFLFSVHFKNCLLDYVSFDRKNMQKSSFENCSLRGANFTQADLSASVIKNCDFYEAIFADSDLSNLDFTTSKNFLIDPGMNNLRKAKFSKYDLTGLLYRHDIIIVD